jgi:transposase
MDNAPIHKAEDMLRVLEPILDLANVRLFFLPKYSPELNPCEMVFAQVRTADAACLLLRARPRPCS